jgi:hypothetical protein
MRTYIAVGLYTIKYLRARSLDINPKDHDMALRGIDFILRELNAEISNLENRAAGAIGTFETRGLDKQRDTC